MCRMSNNGFKIGDKAIVQSRRLSILNNTVVTVTDIREGFGVIITTEGGRRFFAEQNDIIPYNDE